MKHRALVATGIIFLPLAAWTVSKDFNGRMWLAQVPALPANGEDAYGQWIDDGKASLQPGQVFTSFETGMQNQIKDNSQITTPSQASMQQQVSSAQQMAQKYNTPEAQAQLKNMSPDQAMQMAQQIAQQMAPQNGVHAVSPADQAQLQKISNGVFSRHQEIFQEQLAIMKQVNAIDAQWDADSAALDTWKAAAEKALPLCRGEAAMPSGVSERGVLLEYSDKRIALVTKYLPKYGELIQKMRVSAGPEIDFGDDALAAWSQIQDPGLKQQTAPSAHGAEASALGDVGGIEQLVRRISLRAAQPVADKKYIQKTWADAKGCQ